MDNNYNNNNGLNSMGNETNSQHDGYVQQNYSNYDYNQGVEQDFGYNQMPMGSQPDGQKPPKKKMTFTKKMIIAATAACCSGVLIGGAYLGGKSAISYVLSKQFDTSALEENAIEVNETPIDQTAVLETVSTENTVADVVKEAMPSIVSITSTIEQEYNYFGQSYSEEAEGSGSGIIVKETDKELYILTNYHVIEGAKTIMVTFCDENMVEATVKGYDSTADLAVIIINKSDLKEETLSAISVAKLGDSDAIPVGDQVVAIGNALGYGQSVTVGYVSAKDREIDVEGTTMTLIQTDAAINPGNSGGALINMDGEVIGINSLKLSVTEVEGMCYAIPISSAIPIMNELITKEQVDEGEEGYLGITGEDVTEEQNASYGVPMGALVVSVAEGGAASKAGILSGDIITAVNGIEVKSMAALKEKTTSYKAGSTITFTVMRNLNGTYEAQEINVTLMSATEFNQLNLGQDNATEEDNNTEQYQNPYQDPNGDGSDQYGNGSDDFEDFYNYFEEYFNQFNR
ncbi:S1C family serine protease [Anaeromicropila populeti]|uniref:Serine protease Do n=1 Tax=Anaeromicropila populeti TaxID=37658 RepID=A0A1I6HL23_9FIRM|nr:trypsin-like peptidase domain-containing protein [Anaeromicropila populeti]SFR55047.1 serine protease Do [Anaeromicropila populeti]